MTILLGFRNQRFDNDEPLYCTTGTEFVWNRRNGELIEYDTLVAAMSLETYTPKTNEIGMPSLAYQQDHSVGPQIGWGEGTGTIPASNTPTNGEDFTAASGATPPTGWTDGGVADYQVAGGVLTMTNDAVGDDTMTQTQTVVADTDYVAYFAIDSVSGVVTVSADGNALTVDGPGVYRIPYTMAALDVDADLVVTISGIGSVSIDYIRNILASEEV